LEAIGIQNYNRALELFNPEKNMPETLNYILEKYGK
jgi:hypothetical protein